MSYVYYVYHLSARDILGMPYGSEEIGRRDHKRKERKKSMTAYLLPAEQFHKYYLFNF